MKYKLISKVLWYEDVKVKNQRGIVELIGSPQKIDFEVIKEIEHKGVIQEGGHIRVNGQEYYISKKIEKSSHIELIIDERVEYLDSKGSGKNGKLLGLLKSIGIG